MRVTILNRLGCHRRPDRSFFYKGKQFPVCARCTGIFVGEVLLLITYPFLKIGYGMSVLFLVVMFLDWFVQFICVKESTNMRRLITGVLAGYGVTFIQIDAMIFLIVKLVNL